MAVYMSLYLLCHVSQLMFSCHLLTFYSAAVNSTSPAAQTYKIHFDLLLLTFFILFFCSLKKAPITCAHSVLLWCLTDAASPGVNSAEHRSLQLSVSTEAQDGQKHCCSVNRPSPSLQWNPSGQPGIHISFNRSYKILDPFLDFLDPNI